MAELRWLERTVDAAGRPCGLSRAADGNCPGTRKGCVFWLEEILEQVEGKTVNMGGCSHIYLYAIQHEVRSEMIRTQASLDKTATEIKNAGEAVIRAAKGVAGAVLMRSVTRIQEGEPQRALEKG